MTPAALTLYADRWGLTFDFRDSEDQEHPVKLSYALTDPLGRLAVDIRLFGLEIDLVEVKKL